MKKIDSHQHFWKYHPVKDAWITDDMKVIQRDFLPEDLQPILQENNVDGCIAVQADQSEEETHFLLGLAENNDFIKGVVGWIDLRSPDLVSRLDYFSQFKKLKGFRHIVQGEADENFLLGTAFCEGIAQLEKHHFTYDILIFPKHLPVAFEFVKRFPNQKFVIDHLAKPNFKQTDFADWEKGMREIASCPNVYCKVSGLVTEADWKHWKTSDFTYCLDVVTEAFGINRLLFGSDWPVSLLAATYKDSFDIVADYYSKFSKEDQEKIWGGNAIAFYNL
ncbi:amidohydrolase family protein [Flavobacterium nackdongense]|uniref:Amidohydrolase n=1 Tax=Flavobacterium nackdongense TaxID=2547394 RepID=A0A4P6YAH3_9FLAO|nr:amidohydrolase family protein [Flavobacterium nackdongense]QBN20131.1 amidohydrolase [Flavobacterium nackdongense]